MTLTIILRNIGLLLFVIVFLTVAIAVTFSYVIFSDIDKLGGVTDVFRYFAPLAFYIDHAIQLGQIPLWNSLVYCGLPLIGNPQSFIFYPPYLLRSLVTANFAPDWSGTSLVIYMGLHLLFMAFCTYLFGRSHKLSIAGALAAALSFSFSAIMVMRMCDYIFVPTIAWLPLILLLLKKTMDVREVYLKFGIAVLTGFALGMCILSGFVQILYLLGFVMGLYGFLYFLVYSAWSRSESGCPWWKHWLHNSIAMALIFLIASGTAAILLIPVFEFAPYTARVGSVAVPKISNLWGYTPLTFCQSMLVYPGIKVSGESIRNSGIIALILAVVGLTHFRKRDICMFLGIYLILFECCFGPPLPMGTLLEKLTPFSLSAYTRAYDFALFPLSMLVGYGLDAVSRPLAKREYSLGRAFAILFLAIEFLVLLSQWLGDIKFAHINFGVLIIPALAVLIMLFLGTFRLIKPIQMVLVSLLLLLLFGETALWNKSFVPYLAHRKYVDVVTYPKDNFSISKTNNRETDRISNRLLYGLGFAMNGIDPMNVTAIWNLLSAPARENLYLRWVEDWEPTRENLRGNMLFKRSFWLSRYYALGKLPDKHVLYPSATTVFLENEINASVPRVEPNQLPKSSISEDRVETFITAPDPLFQPVPEQSKKNLTFTFSLPEKAPDKPVGPAGAVHSALIYTYTSSTNAQIDTYFTQPETDRAENGMRYMVQPTDTQEGQIEVPLPDFKQFSAKITIDNTGNGEFCLKNIKIRSDNLDEDGLIQILDRKANTVDLRVGPLPEYRILTFLDLYYPGWHAYIDGVETKILKANEQFKAIVVPPGTHEISFRFQPKIIWQAFAISLFTLFMGGVILLVCWNKHKLRVSSEFLTMPYQ